MRRLISALAATSMLAGCASQASLQNLSTAQAEYNATSVMCQQGNSFACMYLPGRAAVVQTAQAQVTQEQNASAAVGLGILALGLGVAAAATSPGCCYYHSHYHHWR